jgi:hypothetical protein
LFTKLAYHLPKELSETKDRLAKAIAA